MAIIFIAVLLSRKITKPILELNESVKGVGDGNFELQLDIHTGDEIQDLADAFTTMTEKLKVYIQNLSETTAAKERIESELKVANSIQCSMLPRIFPPFPERKEINIFATMEPAKEVGGDFYDFFFIDQNKICLCIADVSGKGVPAALFMVISKTLIKYHALLGLPVEEIMTTVNDMLCSDNDESMFVTAFLAILEVNTGRITFSDAGHNLPLICRNGERYDWLTCKKSFVLGGMENTKYSANEGKLEKGDRLFIYTDGITEAMNTGRDSFIPRNVL